MTGSFVDRESRYMQLVNFLYCKLPTLTNLLTSEVGGQCVDTAPLLPLDSDGCLAIF